MSASSNVRIRHGETALRRNFNSTETRRVAMFVAAVGLATASFWAVIQPSTSQTTAWEGVNVPVFEMMRNGPLDLSELTADAI